MKNPISDRIVDSAAQAKECLLLNLCLMTALHFFLRRCLSLPGESQRFNNQVSKNRSMQITKDTILSVAKASCINLTEKEVEQFLADFNTILDAFSKISEVNTKDVQPAFHPIKLQDITRDDVPKQGCTQDQALSLSKHTGNGCFVGPKIL